MFLRKNFLKKKIKKMFFLYKKILEKILFLVFTTESQLLFKFGYSFLFFLLDLFLIIFEKKLHHKWLVCILIFWQFISFFFYRVKSRKEWIFLIFLGLRDQKNIFKNWRISHWKISGVHLPQLRLLLKSPFSHYFTTSTLHYCFFFFLKISDFVREVEPPPP